MKKIVELPLAEPLYRTYHDGIISAVSVNNPSIRNWFLSNCIILYCNTKFLSGYTSPEIRVENYYFDNPCTEIQWIPMRFLGGYINPVIRKMIDSGYYVHFNGVDDYYVPGKTWYKEKHFNHDGAICGYNQFDQTFCIYAYDSNWDYRKFWVPQRSFNKGREAMFRAGVYGGICAIKPTSDKVEFSLQTALKNIKEYLIPNMDKLPASGEKYVGGSIVHEYIAKYVGKLYDGSIAYERMDRRVFRLIWEHKKVMLELITLIEETLNIGHQISLEYKPLVTVADNIRMLYASHHMKRRDSVLPIIQKKLLNLMTEEQMLLNRLLEKIEKETKNASVEIY